MDKSITKYLASIGSKGGRRSRRILTPETARTMVRIRVAKKAYKRLHAACFWSSPIDYKVTAKDLPWVADQLMTYGGHEGWKIGASLCP